MPAVGSFDDADDPNVAASLARAVLAEVNVLRRDPAAYADELRNLESCYDDDVLTYPHSGLAIQTTEGVIALQDCLADLRNSQPLPAVMQSQSIARACQQHVDDMRAGDFCDHIGSDGSTPEERLSAVGDYREQCSENVAFGMRSAKEIVYHMLLDDGCLGRGQRANLLNHDFRFGGVAFGSHPSRETSVVMVFADTFRARPQNKAQQLRTLAESHLGQAAPEEDHPNRGTHKHWDTLVQETKPDHLRVPNRLLDHVHRVGKPRIYVKPRERLRTIYAGQLRPQASVDPVSIRAFVHRADSDYDDLINESDMLGLAHAGQLNLSPKDIATMFDEICVRRPIADQRRRTINWKEVCAAAQIKKRYVPVVDLHIETAGGDGYMLVVETDKLSAWCTEVHSEFCDTCTSPLPRPAGAAEARSGPRNTGGGARTAELNAFLAALIAAELQSGAALQDEPKVQNLIKLGCSVDVDGQPVDRVSRLVCMSQRRLWAFQMRPHREAWLRLIATAGLDPLVPLAEQFLAKSETDSPAAAKDAPRQSANLARPDAKSASTVPAGTGKMAVREPPPKVCMRSPSQTATSRGLPEGTAEGAADPAEDPTMRLGAAARGNATMKPWEEKRHHTETLVNQVLHNEMANFTLPGGGVSGADSAAPEGAEAAPMAYTFEARRKFRQVLGAQTRASDEQRFLSSQQRLGRSLTSSVGLKGRGAGAHSLSAPGGARGHFHDSLAAHGAEASHAWPMSLDIRLDGEHLDHSLAPEMKPNPKYSKMDAKEREKQFSCLFNKDALPDTNELKKKVAQYHAPDVEQWSKKPHEFRADCPQRHGKYGRRAFDPQVKGRPIPNVHNMSEVDNKPVEEFRRQQDRVHEYLERAMPMGQSRHFKTHLPHAEKPGKYYDMATGEQVNTALEGGLKRPEHGFFQNRHSSSRDMNLYTRPMGASHMDRMIPLA